MTDGTETDLARARPGNGRVGLAVMEAQVLHFGHVALLSWMMASCGRRIVALGSSQASGRPGHPFTFNQRREMVEQVFGKGAFTFVSLNDIAATVPEDWVDYVHGRLDSMRLPRATDYFCGSRYDARWYEGAYGGTRGDGEREGPGTVWTDANAPGGLRRMRILDRDAGDYPSGRQVRDLVELRDPDWRRHVPPVLWDYVDWNYPPSLRVALRDPREPEPSLHPVGTLWKPPGEGRGTMALYDDMRWRGLADATDEKGRWAAERAAARDAG